MSRELQLAAVAAIQKALPEATITAEVAPAWLVRPGKVECKGSWTLPCSIYEQLTGLELPEGAAARAPPSRRADRTPGWPPRLFEFDESQHFNAHRAKALRAYPAAVETAFPRETWLRASEGSTKKLGTTGGWGRAKPPLFPEPGGRHLQRAFRDALADLLATEHDWAPTLRIAEFEAQTGSWAAAPPAECGSCSRSVSDRRPAALTPASPLSSPADITVADVEPHGTVVHSEPGPSPRGRAGSDAVLPGIGYAIAGEVLGIPDATVRSTTSSPPVAGDGHRRPRGVRPPRDSGPPGQLHRRPAPIRPRSRSPGRTSPRRSRRRRATRPARWPQ